MEGEGRKSLAIPSGIEKMVGVEHAILKQKKAKGGIVQTNMAYMFMKKYQKTIERKIQWC